VGNEGDEWIINILRSEMPGPASEFDKLKDNLDSIGELIDSERVDGNSLFKYTLISVVTPLVYSASLIMLACMPYHLFYTARLIVESLAVGLYEDYWNKDQTFREKLEDAKDFTMKDFMECGKQNCEQKCGQICNQDEKKCRKCKQNCEKCNRYARLRQRVNKALSWLRDELGVEPIEFIYRGIYNPFSKMIHPVTKCDNLTLGTLSLTPVIPVLLPPDECKSDTRVPKVFYGALAYTRLAINMLIYAWGSLVGKLSSEELEDVRRRIGDALKSVEAI
jgi:hypothetical protein